MICWGRKINENYAWELSGLHKARKFSDGVTAFELVCDWDKHLADFEISLVILNFVVVEFNIYYLWHRDKPEPIYNETTIWTTNLNSSTLTITANSDTHKPLQISETQ
jgi:hypothetical protein